jgi:ubiquinone biosynthesis monooxygenase Coq7
MPLPRLDTLLDATDQALRTLFTQPSANRDNPATQHAADGDPTQQDPVTSAALMRVNHAGEVAAQALYQGQQLFARDPSVRDRLAESAGEEQDHLAWCAQRLQELDARPSRLNPLWYVGAYSIGAVAGLFGDRVSLGFVAETEKQVVEHLHDHLTRLPEGDARSQAILEQMALDEADHGQAALLEGGILPPRPVRRLMGLAGEIIRQVAYRV